jgi:hypothetical protein
MAMASAIKLSYHKRLFLLLLAFRKKWIERPVVRFLASLLMDK